MTILTTDEFRAFVTTALEDAALQMLLDAAETEILRAAGAPGSTEELFRGGGRLVALGRQAESIASIVETIGSTDTTLDANDYLLHPDLYVIERLSTGPNGRSYWYGRVLVTYTPTDDEALRQGVQRDLVNLMLNYVPGLTMEQVGAWTQQFAANSAWNTDEERANILARLDGAPSLIVVGSQ